MTPEERQALREKHVRQQWQICGMCGGYWGEECGPGGSLCNEKAYPIDKHVNICNGCDPYQFNETTHPCDVIKVLDAWERQEHNALIQDLIHFADDE